MRSRSDAKTLYLYKLKAPIIKFYQPIKVSMGDGGVENKFHKESRIVKSYIERTIITNNKAEPL